MINWKDIKIQLRTTVILNNISLELKRGESLGIIGENASGKTILVYGPPASVFFFASSILAEHSASDKPSHLFFCISPACQQHGKKAFYRKGDNLLLAMFDCR